MGTITVGKLHKFLGDLIAKGHARKPVCVDKATFWNPLEADGATILGVEKGRFMWIPHIDDDGGTKVNKDGSESGRACLVLRGEDPHSTPSGGIAGTAARPTSRTDAAAARSASFLHSVRRRSREASHLSPCAAAARGWRGLCMVLR